ncbi:hypothetical protein [Pseudomonas sp. RIT-PI-AD]|uniref:hypothetical protein n=1 Tax=Pseudomonas sp. RIT-PI-AD TaxID=3035294 RepID=UPI0021DA3BFA|nr:hypothetical protein [Pseudomonas sp. RIT-PI-AD]
MRVFLRNLAKDPRHLDAFFRFMRYALYIGQASMIAYIGFKYHVVEDWIGDNPELDFYAAKIHSYLQFVFPRDRFRPAHYTLLSTALAWVTRDAFLAGKIVSMISGVAFYVLVGRIARAVFNRTTEVAVLFFLLGSLPLLMASVRVASDMLFWALLAGATVLALGIFDRPAKREHALVCLGLLLGAAAGVRYTASFLFIPLGIVLWIGVREDFSPRRTSGLCGLVLLGFFVGYLPAALMNIWIFGEPFYSENWRNTLFSYFEYRSYLGVPAPAGFDTYALVRAEKSVYLAEALAHPDLFVGKTVWALVGYFRNGLARDLLQLGTEWTTLVWAGGCCGLGGFALLARGTPAGRRYGHVYLLVLVLVFFILTAFAFLLANRLVLLPGLIVLIYFWGSLSRLSPPLVVALLIGVSIDQLPAKLAALEQYAGKHPLSDIAALKRIEALSAGDRGKVVVVGTNIFLRPRTELNYKRFVPPLRLLQDDQAKAEYCELFSSKIAARHPDFVLVGSVSSYGYATPQCPEVFPSSQWNHEDIEAAGATTRLYIKGRAVDR